MSVDTPISTGRIEKLLVVFEFKFTDSKTTIKIQIEWNARWQFCHFSKLKVKRVTRWNTPRTKNVYAILYINDDCRSRRKLVFFFLFGNMQQNPDLMNPKLFLRLIFRYISFEIIEFLSKTLRMTQKRNFSKLWTSLCAWIWWVKN